MQIRNGAAYRWFIEDKSSIPCDCAAESAMTCSDHVGGTRSIARFTRAMHVRVAIGTDTARKTRRNTTSTLRRFPSTRPPLFQSLTSSNPLAHHFVLQVLS